MHRICRQTRSLPAAKLRCGMTSRTLRSTQVWDHQEYGWGCTDSPNDVRSLLAQRRDLEETSTRDKAKLRNDAETARKESLNLSQEMLKLKVSSWCCSCAPLDKSFSSLKGHSVDRKCTAFRKMRPSEQRLPSSRETGK